jgi:regulator of replication initiation timing
MMEDLTEEELLSKLNMEQVIQPKPIPLELFGKRTSKITRLINNSQNEIVQKGQNRWYEFRLNEPVYVLSISIHTEDYSGSHIAEAEWSGPSSSAKASDKTKNHENQFRYDINAFVSEFSFKPEKRYLGDPKIRCVAVEGFTAEEFREISNIASRLDGYKNEIVEIANSTIAEANECREEINAFDEKKKQLISDIDSLEDTCDETKTDLESLKAQRDELKSEIISLKSEESDVTSRFEILEDSIDQKKSEQRNLNRKISDSTFELKTLKENINMFPSEIGGFVDQGASNISKYTWLSLVPIIVLVLVTVALFSNAADLTVVYKEQDNVSIWFILLTRLPFVAIAITLIHACYKLAKVFIAEIMRINQQRLNLSKISIIATDVSSASLEGLDPTEDQIYQARTQLKMELLREHLKDYISENYQYKTEGSPSIFGKRKKEEEAMDSSDKDES